MPRRMCTSIHLEAIHPDDDDDGDDDTLAADWSRNKPVRGWLGTSQHNECFCHGEEVPCFR